MDLGFDDIFFERLKVSFNLITYKFIIKTPPAIVFLYVFLNFYDKFVKTFTVT